MCSSSGKRKEWKCINLYEAHIVQVDNLQQNISKTWINYELPTYSQHIHSISTSNIRCTRIWYLHGASLKSHQSVCFQCQQQAAQMHIDTSTYTYARHLVCWLLPTHFHNLSHLNFIILYYLYDICSIISCKLVNLLHKRMNRSDEKATKPYTKHKHVIRLFCKKKIPTNNMSFSFLSASLLYNLNHLAKLLCKFIEAVMKFVTMNAVAQFKQNEWKNVHVIKYTGTNSFHSTCKHTTSQTFVIMLNFNNIKYTACFESTLLCVKNCRIWPYFLFANLSL